MQTLEIKVSVDITNPDHMAAASQFLATLGGIKTPKATLEVVKDEPPVVEKSKRKRRPKAEIEAAKAAKETPTDETEATTPTSTDAETQAGNQPEEGSDEPTYKIADVRTKLSEKVGTHRAAIKAKLKELEAKNVSSLEESDYGNFMDFLNGLA